MRARLSTPQPGTTSRFRGLLRSRKTLVVLATVIALAVTGTTVGYAALTKKVTLTLDGDTRQVSAMGSTVGAVLETQGVEVTDKDFVAPSLTEQVRDGDEITVRFGRPLELSVDGEARTYWVNSTDVASALGEIGRRFHGADLSVSRSAPIGRSGMELEVVTPKVLEVKIGAKELRKRKLTALTVADALEAMGVDVGKRDVVKPSLATEITDGDKVVVTKIRVAKERVSAETIESGVIERESGKLFEGEEKVLRDGRDGVRDVTYRLRFVNGRLVARKVVASAVTRKPVPTVVLVGTKEKPEESTSNFAGGNTVWDALAKCESGGNWGINTGNGYYGGLQFSLSTWRSVGGSGYPHQHSREEQIKRGQILQARAGWGQWPHCSSKLGLR